ncbi:MAG: amidase [Gemmatimonadales bacterium]|nr:amidase [Gemmatimonadales bacterium]
MRIAPFGRRLGAALLLATGPACLAAQASFDVTERSARELQAALQAGTVTSVALVDAYLARIAAYDVGGPGLNSVIRQSASARTDAARLDAERRAGRVRGPLHGIPILLKDNFDTADAPTSGSSLALATLRPGADAFVVQRLREAGAIILGKTNMHELAAGITSISSLGGQTRNPYDPRRCPGGSSGGTGVAIAASFAAIGWGSDTCGSIRIPAAYNSLFGLRPTQGLVSRSGVQPLSHTQDIAGPLARTAADLAIALEVSVGYDPADPTTASLANRPPFRFLAAVDSASLRGVRLGMLTALIEAADADIRDTVRAAAAAMAQHGAELVPVAIPELDGLLRASGVLNYETKFDLAEYLSRVPGAPVASLSEILDRGLYHDALDARFRRADTVSSPNSEPYRQTLAGRAVLRERLVAVLDSLKLDALVYPTMQRRPVLVGDPQLGGTCQLSANSGMPALSAPAGFTADGLPVAYEMLGRPYDDVRLVAIAAAFERVGPRRRPPPNTPPLVRGRAPAAQRFTVRGGNGSGRTVGEFSFEPSTGDLRYRVRVTGVPADQVNAVVLRRNSGGTPGPVIERLVRPGTLTGEGVLTLVGVNRSALDAGQLSIELFTTEAPSGTAAATLSAR